MKLLLNQREKCEEFLKQLINEDTIKILNHLETPSMKAFVVFVPNVKINTQDLVEDLVVKLIEKQEVFNKLDFHEKEKKEAVARAKDYDQMQRDLVVLQDFKLFEKYHPKFSTAHEEAINTIETKLQTHYGEIQSNYLKPNNKNYSEDDCIKINKNIENLKIFSDKFPIFQKSCKENVTTITTTLSQKFLEKKEEAMKSNDVNSIVNVLVQLQAVNYVEAVKKSEWIDEILVAFKKKAVNWTQEMDELGVLLQGHSAGKTLVSENQIQGLNLSLVNKKLLWHYRIDEVLETIEGDELDKDLLKKRYEEGFRPIYESLVRKYLNSNPVEINLQALKNELKLVLQKLSSTGVISKIQEWFKESKKNKK